jgi:hypothetical protein
LFGTIKTWVGDLVASVGTTQKSNEDTIQNLHEAINLSDHIQLTARNLRAAQTPLLVDSSMIVNEIKRIVTDLQERRDSQGLTDQDILELFSNLFGQANWRERGIICTPSPTVSSHGKRYHPTSSQKSSEVEETIIGNSSPVYAKSTENQSHGQQVVETKRHDDIISAIHVLREVPFLLSPSCDSHPQVDDILTQLSIFWSNTDVILDALTKKGQHIESFVPHTRNPNIVTRFRELLIEYRSAFLTLHCLTALFSNSGGFGNE